MQRKLLLLCLVLFMIVSVSGCATPMVVGLKKQRGHYIPTDPSKGYIYIYREGEFFGCARGIFVTADGKRIGGLNSGSYFVHEADPGEITISVENWLQDNPSRIINVEAGKKYYLKGSLKFGLLDASPHIEIVHEAEGEQAVKGLTYATVKIHR